MSRRRAAQRPTTPITSRSPRRTESEPIERRRRMATSRGEWQFGRIYDPEDGRLAKTEEEPILEPEIPIVDPHHHLWLRNGHRYLLDELLADLNTGHNVVATVFEECHSMYRSDGPPEFRP